MHCRLVVQELKLFGGRGGERERTEMVINPITWFLNPQWKLLYSKYEKQTMPRSEIFPIGKLLILERHALYNLSLGKIEVKNRSVSLSVCEMVLPNRSVSLSLLSVCEMVLP